ncbi:MAG: aminomethyl-transferring glycine dehydrogenase subunit GcvPA [Vampirovibrionia bacterium]
MSNYNYLPQTKEDRTQMLKEIGLTKEEDLFKPIPEELKNCFNLFLPDAYCELELQNRILELAKKNVWSGDYISFLGAGCYDRFIPSIVESITSKVEFLTAYTPYQPEISQGTLQAIYEFQSMMCALTGMDVANASMYDGATATAEAILMACRVTRRSKAIIARTLNPETQDVIRTYLNGPEIKLDIAPMDNEGITDLSELQKMINKETACVVIQMPNFLGCLEEVRKIESIVHETGALFVVAIDPISVGLIKSPGKYNADIVVGDGQSLGCNMMYGGPAFGFMACKEKYMRQMPGRIAGATLDKDGNTAYTLTLQTREQHIRREKATSNICSNQALCALSACVYLSAIGPKGLKEVANISFQRAHHLANKIANIPGFSIHTENFFNEFILLLPEELSEESFNKKMIDLKIIPGINISSYYEELPRSILISITEKNKLVDIYLFLTDIK